ERRPRRAVSSEHLVAGTQPCCGIDDGLLMAVQYAPAGCHHDLRPEHEGFSELGTEADWKSGTVEEHPRFAFVVKAIRELGDHGIRSRRIEQFHPGRPRGPSRVFVATAIGSGRPHSIKDIRGDYRMSWYARWIRWPGGDEERLDRLGPLISFENF